MATAKWLRHFHFVLNGRNWKIFSNPTKWLKLSFVNIGTVLQPHKITTVSSSIALHLLSIANPCFCRTKSPSPDLGGSGRIVIQPRTEPSFHFCKRLAFALLPDLPPRAAPSLPTAKYFDLRVREIKSAHRTAPRHMAKLSVSWMPVFFSASSRLQRISFSVWSGEADGQPVRRTWIFAAIFFLQSDLPS